MLSAEIDERLFVKRENLMSSLKEVRSVSIAIDAWSMRQKTFMSIAVNWIDPNDFRRISSLIGCEVFDAASSNEYLIEQAQQIYSDYNISSKIVATVTNNNLQYERSNLFNEVIYLQLDKLVNHIKNPTHSFELIGIDVANKALANEQYAEAHKSVFTKFDALMEYVKQRNLPKKSASNINTIFNHHSAVGSKVTEIYNTISNLATCDTENLNETLVELHIPIFTETDFSFMKEYALIIEPIATAIEYLQKNNCYYATLLPMVYSMKDNLMDVQQNRGLEIQLCQPLLTAILNGVEQTFEHLFDFTNEKCVPAIIATCTHPFFKMRWLKDALKTPTNTNHILDLLVKVAKEYDDGKKGKTEEGTSTKDGKEEENQTKLRIFLFKFHLMSKKY